MKTILLIDDDPQLRQVFGLALRRAGYHVLEADSGTAGLEVARQHLPDLILSDIHMPGGDGSTLLRKLRDDPALGSKQIVLMTGQPDLVTPRSGMEQGADDFLVKPVSAKALLACVAARFSRASISWRVEDQMLARLKSTVPKQLPHEFFTPLAGIIGLLEILRDSGATLSPEEVGDIHNDVYESALRLHRTLRNYLLILDLQNASAEVKPGAVLPAQEVEEAIRNGLFEALRLNHRSDDVTIEIDAVPLPVNAGDLTRLVEELIDNACKFSRPGTPIDLRLDSGGHLSVADHGRGMTAEEIEHVGAFQQFDRSRQEQQGLGLGLVLVQKIAALVSAEFSMTSDPGKGTTVQLVFPKPGV